MRMYSLMAVALSLSACAPGALSDDPEQGSYEGVDEDTDPSLPMDDGKSDAPYYDIPGDLPPLFAPEVIISLRGLTVHLFDRQTGFSEVYPAGVGVKGATGYSITPIGHFTTGPSSEDTWWYVARRTIPEYFGGLPFLRVTAQNGLGLYTYGLHGPITEELIRGYVSHGCVRMAADDIVRVFWSVLTHPSTPVTIQQEIERDADGQRVDVGMTPALWAVGEPIEFGDSVGPRPF